jgi:hypothetical protein
MDFNLKLGDFRTEVTVHGDPPLINSENASVGTVIDSDTLDKMPLNGRGIKALIELSPGVVAVPVTARTADNLRSMDSVATPITLLWTASAPISR